MLIGQSLQLKTWQGLENLLPRRLSHTLLAIGLSSLLAVGLNFSPHGSLYGAIHNMAANYSEWARGGVWRGEGSPKGQRRSKSHNVFYNLSLEMIHHFHHILLAMCERIIQWYKCQEAGIIRAILEVGHTEEKSC